eukprot:CAMPEP_0175114848 /NCGR_PEP_ID=MMETSP0086_2-20121207/17145_1 /TAXON_ID=136419 /ORGANISM="Unknown Unknown, Strain D1" /LENGTH=51 /DNA_ID=CAMNT_0016394665 /DNA_START=79 /DNA_END=230 /DNA_ORIENTATION=-
MQENCRIATQSLFGSILELFTNSGDACELLEQLAPKSILAESQYLLVLRNL